MNQSKQPTYRELAAYTEKEMTASDAATLEDALARFPEGRRRLTRVDAATAYLRDTEAVDGVDLLPRLKQQIKIAHRSKPEQGSSRRFSPRMVGLAAAIVAVALPIALFLTRTDTSSHSNDGFRAKSATAHVDVRSRWIALNAFRLSGHSEPEQLRDTLHLHDGLLFSYTNLGPEPFSHLMIFGVDDRDRIYWYYPAFLDARDNPKGIDIEKGVSRAALQEVIAHAYREGSLTLFGLFSDHALSVSEIENAMQGGARDKDGLETAFDGVRVKALQLRVVQ